MILARIAVTGAIICTLWFNGSYAWSKGGGPVHQIALVVVALTIDLCKASFLPAASTLWQRTWRLPALALIVLWPLTFAYSTFAGYSAIASNRAVASASPQAEADKRRRALVNYDQAGADLATAKASPLWSASAACTAPKDAKHRNFCDGIARTTQQQTSAAAQLDATPPAQVDPELAVLRDNTGYPLATLTLIVAFVPAFILELVSSFGLYAISNRNRPEAPERPVRSVLRSRLSGWRLNRKNASVAISVAPAPVSTQIGPADPKPPAKPIRLPSSKRAN